MRHSRGDVPPKQPNALLPGGGHASHAAATIGRREALALVAAAGSALAMAPDQASAQAPGQSRTMLTRSIPSSGAAMPIVGLGSWITFNVGEDPVALASCGEVIGAFLGGGGRMIDCSPMYGSSQKTIGAALAKSGTPPRLFSAEKVWTSRATRAAAQIEEARRSWGVPKFDLLQVHNLLAWEEHLPMLLAMKAAGQLRYVGITTSEGRRHEEVERIMASHKLDFIQLTYNVLDREAENRLLPMARERGIAVIANRPFQEGALIKRVQRHRLPGWAGEIDCANWAQLLLKFIVAHPAITCAIPATANLAHLRENIGAAFGRLPDEALRGRMIAHVESL